MLFVKIPEHWQAYQTNIETVYYHAILLTFRPFLIVAAARQRQRLVAADIPGDTPGISLAGDEMWLREACRYAVDSSRDQISFMMSSIRETDICKVCARLLGCDTSEANTYKALEVPWFLHRE